MCYYSQYKQDKYLNEIIFRQKKEGTFLDIGANDGVSFSNTFFFEKELNWKGVCIEPLQSAFQKLQITRTSINLNYCASNEDKTDYFLSVNGYGEMLSGLKSKYDPRHLERVYHTIKNHGGSIDEIEVECVNINRILEIHSMTEIDFISIDTEGNELEILRAIDFDRIGIKAITVENNYKSSDLEQFLARRSFVKVKTLETDEVFINRSYFGFFKELFIKIRSKYFNGKN